MNIFSVQEAVDFDLGCATEAQNCLAEGGYEAARLSSLVEVAGEGPILLTVSAPYYCKATDGFAGQQVVARTRFATRALARANMAEWPQEGDFCFKITPPEANHAAEVESDKVPF